MMNNYFKKLFAKGKKMKNCIVFCIAFLLMIPIISFNEPWWAYLWIIPVIAYIIAVSLKKEKKSTDKRSVATNAEVYKSFLTIFFCFCLLSVLLSFDIYWNRRNGNSKFFVYVCLFFTGSKYCL